jgi:hypothetical protein
LPFAMPGEWQVDLSVATPDDRGGVRVDWDLWN